MGQRDWRRRKGTKDADARGLDDAAYTRGVSKHGGCGAFTMLTPDMRHIRSQSAMSATKAKADSTNPALMESRDAAVVAP
jgi:hypothetical protein